MNTISIWDRALIGVGPAGIAGAGVANSLPLPQAAMRTTTSAAMARLIDTRTSTPRTRPDGGP